MPLPTKQPHWHRYFFVLAGFNLFTVLLSVYVSWNLMSIYNKSVKDTEIWTRRISGIVALSQDAFGMMAQVSDLMQTRNAARDCADFQGALNKYHADVEHCRKEITQQMEAKAAAPLLAQLAKVESAAASMAQQAELIFSKAVQADFTDGAKNLAVLGLQHAGFNDALVNLRGAARSMQMVEFESELHEEAAVQNYQYLIAALIVLMVISATLYGLRVSKQVELDARARAKAEEEAIKAREAAELANRAKSEFLANMSHELRTPLNGVIGMSELLINSKLTGRQYDYAQTVRRSAESLLTILNDILDLSKIEAGKLTLENIPFDLQNVVEEVGVLMSARASEKNLEMIVRFSPGAPRMVVGDPIRIRQVISNLVGNAVKFTSRGQVLIEACCSSRVNGKAALQLRISDSGIGIAPGQEQKLFQKFTQLDSSTTRRFGGTGLGLAICKSIVDMMGGSIDMVSQPGKGSVFTVSLTLPEALGTEPARPRCLRPELRGMRVLIVDDNEVNRKVLCEQMTAWGMRHTAVSSGGEALDALVSSVESGKPFDLAILDFQMPEMDGEMLAKAIKANPAIKGTTLIMLTSMGHQFSSERMKAAGLDAMLHKPTRQAVLIETLNNVLAATSGERPTVRASSSGAVRSTPRGDLQGLNVLLVEDNDVNREVALGMLERLGCRVTVAVDGREAMDKVPTDAFDAILMDCQMPVMDGFEATAEIRRLEWEAGNGAHVPVIAMTASAMNGDRERCLSAGMDEYVAKPVHLDSLAAVLAKQARHASAPQAAPAPAPIAAEPAGGVDLVAALETACGKPERLKRIFRAFVGDAPLRITALRTALKNGDVRTAEREAHSLKGAAGNIAAMALRKHASEAELACKSGELNRASEICSAIEAALAPVMLQVTSYIAAPVEVEAV